MGWEEGFRCRRCGRIRLPFLSNIREFWVSYVRELERVREEGIGWERANGLI